jgi:hypothetical protein
MITDAIERRRSVRTYTGEPLDEATAAKITDYIATLKPPFGAECRVELVRTAASAEPVRLGTYGAIRGAGDYLALVIGSEGPLAEEGAAYMFEQVILYCTSMGLGTCWLVGFFDRGGFKNRLALRPGERLRAVSPVGHAADKPHRSLSTLGGGGKPTPRRAFSELFFRGSFSEPLSETAAGEFACPLEMVRLGPSANNRQTWRVLLDAGATPDPGEDGAAGAPAAVLHLYKVSSMGYEALDAGIAMCHFAETCRQVGIAGRWETLTDAPQPPRDAKATYVASWVAE